MLIMQIALGIVLGVILLCIMPLIPQLMMSLSSAFIYLFAGMLLLALRIAIFFVPFMAGVWVLFKIGVTWWLVYVLSGLATIALLCAVNVWLLQRFPRVSELLFPADGSKSEVVN